MHRAEIKLHSLTDSYRSGAKHKDFLFCPVSGSHHLVYAAIAGIVIGGFGFKFSGTGVHHLIGSLYIMLIAQLFNLGFRPDCAIRSELGDYLVRKFHTLCFS